MGFDRSAPKTLLGNQLAFRCLLILWVADMVGLGGLCEQPRLSKMRWLPVWRTLAQRSNFSEDWLASCAYGAPYRKEFVFLALRADVHVIHRKCPGFHSHARIEGALTKTTSTYVQGVADALASVAAKSVAHISTTFHSHFVAVDGSERALINELILCQDWKTLYQWDWDRPQHINLLEGRLDLRLWISTPIVHDPVEGLQRFLWETWGPVCSHTLYGE